MLSSTSITNGNMEVSICRPVPFIECPIKGQHRKQRIMCFFDFEHALCVCWVSTVICWQNYINKSEKKSKVQQVQFFLSRYCEESQLRGGHMHKGYETCQSSSLVLIELTFPFSFTVQERGAFPLSAASSGFAALAYV